MKVNSEMDMNIGVRDITQEVLDPTRRKLCLEIHTARRSVVPASVMSQVCDLMDITKPL